MGVFAVIGMLIVFGGLAARNGRVVILGLILFGIGVAGDTNGY